MVRFKKTRILKLIGGCITLIFLYKLLLPGSESCKSVTKNPNLVNPRFNHTQFRSSEYCSSDTKFCVENIPVIDIQMLDVYNKTNFQHTPNGEWEEGWCVNSKPYKIDPDNKLQVFVVPHSHNDPGWLKTFDEYYLTATRYILNNIMRNLKEFPQLKFIWAEMSFFSRWYEDLRYKEEMDVVKSLLRENRLEIVTGGWVMPDEANSHWYSLLIQLIEGQTWLRDNLNYTPTSAWAIDPFGHSPSMTYILKQAGLENMVIGRTHYIVKKHFSMYKDLEFEWKQMWDGSKDTQMFTHMLPFSSYAIHYSHGPNKAICKLFDFRKTDKWYWPWEDRPVPITSENVRQRADLLVNEWRKKAELYQTNAILIPHGDDFRYITQDEWDAQRKNLQRLFRYINNEENYNIHVKFSTLRDYFKFVELQKPFYTFPSLSGDFFTYSDEKEDYWSGYFTTRPYHKRLDRKLLHSLRTAEMIHSLDEKSSNSYLLENVRRTHSLFQHHDGVTGTARERVMQDYASRMHEALHDCKRVVENDSSGQVLFTTEDLPSEDHFKEASYTINVFNSLASSRIEIIEAYSPTPFLNVFDSKGSKVLCQIVPLFEWKKERRLIYLPSRHKSLNYRVIFKAEVPPLNSITFKIEMYNASTLYDTSFTKMPEVITYTNDYKSFLPAEFKVVKPLQEFDIQMNYGNKYHFNENGLLRETFITQNTHIPLKIEFLKYKTHQWPQDKSGAYLFRPNGNAVHLYNNRNVVVIVKGELETRLNVGFEFGVHEIVFSNNEIEINNLIDIGHRDDTEIVMKITTDIQNDNVFYTDLNGFQIAKRNRLKKLPLQANYYPIPSTIFIQDNQYRLTALSAQSLGGSSVKSGQIEIMQDRRLTESDGRGLGEGVLDNRPTTNKFKLILENQKNINSIVHQQHPSGFHSNQSHYELQRFLYPIVRGINLLLTKQSSESSMVSQPNGLEIVLLKRFEGTKDIGIVLFKSYLNGQGQNDIYKIDLKQLLSLKSGKLYSSKITLLSKEGPEIENYLIELKQMEAKGFIIKTAIFND